MRSCADQLPAASQDSRAADRPRLCCEPALYSCRENDTALARVTTIHPAAATLRLKPLALLPPARLGLRGTGLLYIIAWLSLYFLRCACSAMRETTTAQLSACK